MSTDNITNIVIDLDRLAANLRRMEMDLEARWLSGQMSRSGFETALRVVREVAHETIRGASVGAIEDSEWEAFLEACTVRGHHVSENVRRTA